MQLTNSIIYYSAKISNQTVKPYYYRNPNSLKFNQLMNTTNKPELTKLCLFVESLLKSVKSNF